MLCCVLDMGKRPKKPERKRREIFAIITVNGKRQRELCMRK
jgi:hypothetical protein